MKEFRCENSETINENLEIAIVKFLQEIGKVKDIVIASVAGIGASGKSTLTQNIAARLGNDVAILGTDDYLIPKAERRKLGITIGNPVSTKLDLLGDHLERIKRGETVTQPVYYGETKEREFVPGKYVILEGTWALAEKFHHLFDLKIYIERDIELQKARRFERDTTIKGQTREEILKLLYARQQEFDFHITPNKRYADIVLRSHPDSSLEILEDKIGLETI